MRNASRGVTYWRARALTIPDPTLRQDALAAIERKRGNIEGAALFWTLPNRRSRDLLRLLVTYELLADFLDCVNERGAHAGIGNGLWLHRALIEALEPGLDISDYYQQHPWKDDGGYLKALVNACRELCLRLPSYESVRPLILRAASLAQVLALNHEPDARVRDAALREWAETHCDQGSGLAWFELTAGASAWLTILALLALAAESELDEQYIQDAYVAYLRWVSLAGTMLDSYSDIVEDAENRDHSYIAHYQHADIATKRITEIIRRSLQEVAALSNGERHVVVVSCMIAMYLTKDSTRTRMLRTTTLQMAQAGGRLTRSLTPVLRAWRLLYGQQEA